MFPLYPVILAVCTFSKSIPRHPHQVRLSQGIILNDHVLKINADTLLSWKTESLFWWIQGELSESEMSGCLMFLWVQKRERFRRRTWTPNKISRFVYKSCKFITDLSEAQNKVSSLSWERRTESQFKSLQSYLIYEHPSFSDSILLLY